MKSFRLLISIPLLGLASVVSAVDDLTIDSAIGGAVGGAIGGAVGAELGGRKGAIVGAGIGAATGTAINTRDHVEQDDHHHHETPQHPVSNGHFCPPGQAKKGRC